MDFNQGQIQKQAQFEADRYQSGSIAGNTVPTPTQIDTVGNVLQLVVSQAVELRERTANIAEQIAGPIPQSPNKEVEQPNSLVGLLRMLSNRLGDSLREVERTQRSL